MTFVGEAPCKLLQSFSVPFISFLLCPVIDLKEPLLLVSTDCCFLYWLGIVLPYCSSACCLISWDSPWAGRLTKDKKQHVEIDKETMRKYQFHTKTLSFPHAASLVDVRLYLTSMITEKKVSSRAKHWHNRYHFEIFCKPQHLPATVLMQFQSGKIRWHWDIARARTHTHPHTL